MKNKYMIVIPVCGSEGTRNPHTKYYGVGARLFNNKEQAYINDDLDYFKSRIKELKKQSEFYKKAFICKI